MGYSEARGPLTYEKNLKSKFSCQTPFKTFVPITSKNSSSGWMHVSVVGYLLGWTGGNLRFGWSTVCCSCSYYINTIKSIFIYSVSHVCTLRYKQCDRATNKRRHFMSSLMIYGERRSNEERAKANGTSFPAIYFSNNTVFSCFCGPACLLM